MNDSSHDSGVLERRLVETFNEAHDDPRWAGTTWHDPLHRLGRARQASRRRTALASTLGVAALTAGAIAGVAALPSSSDHLKVVGTLSGGDKTGSDWLLPLDKYQAYEAAHPQPSGGPELVQSPAPRDAALTDLEAALQHVLPSGTRVLRDDAASGGAKGHLEVVLRLPDGSPVDVERYQLDYPVPLAAYTGTGTPDSGFADEHFTDPQAWANGTAYSVITGSSWGYSLPQADGGDSWSGPFVYTATNTGVFTEITSPVSSDRMVGWAQQLDTQLSTG